MLGDLGWYNIRFSQWVMKNQLPERVSGRILHEQGSGKTPVPVEFSGELFFPGGVSATFYCSFRTENEQWATVSGTKGSISLEDFVLPFYGAEAAFEVEPALLPRLGLLLPHGKPPAPIRRARVQRGRCRARRR